MPGRNGLGDLALDFNAHVIGREQVLPGAASRLTQRECRRKHGDGGMREQSVDAILGDGELGVVVIVGVDEVAVGEGGESRREFLRGADHRALARARSKRLNVFLHERRERRDRSGERQAEAVEDRLLAQRHHVIGNVFVTRVDDEFRDVAREAGCFGKFLSRARRGKCGTAQRQPSGHHRALAEIATLHGFRLPTLV